MPDLNVTRPGPYDITLAGHIADAELRGLFHHMKGNAELEALFADLYGPDFNELPVWKRLALLSDTAKRLEAPAPAATLLGDAPETK